MTEKLYDINQYLREFTAGVISIREEDGKYHLELDRTCFYPEGGGQPCDKGQIGSCEVEQVYEESGRIFHVTGTRPSKLEGIACSIDWARRFDHMQQHLGQHMLSSVLYEAFGISTLSFHLGNEAATIDLDALPDPGQLLEAEESINGVIYENRPVKIFYPLKDELAGMTLRKAPQVAENIRIVEIKDLDRSACCGTHPLSTGEVGLVKVIRSDKYKGGGRLEFLCGGRALRDYSWKSAAVSGMAAALSIRDTDLSVRFGQLCSELAELKKNAKLLEEQLLDYKVDELVLTAVDFCGIKLVIIKNENPDLDKLRLLSRKLALQPGVVFITAFYNGSAAEFIFSRSRELDFIDLRVPCKKALELLEGKGGGSEAAVQGRGIRAEKLDEVLENTVSWIKNILSNR